MEHMIMTRILNFFILFILFLTPSYAAEQVLGWPSNAPILVVGSDGGTTISGNCSEFDSNGNLTDSGSACGGSSGAFSDASDPVVLNTTTKDVNIGTTLNNSAKLSVDGDSDQVQLSIQGNSTQISNLFVIEESDGTDVMTGNINGVRIAQNFDAASQVQLSNLTNCNTLDTNGSGIVSCGTDETGAGGGDEITVNTIAATNANFIDNLYMDFGLDTATSPDDITSKFNLNAASGDLALLLNEGAFALNGFVFEGATANTIEYYIAIPDPITTDKTITFPNATDTLVGKDTTDVLTNKTMTAAANVIDADTAVALAADPTDCATSTHFAVGVIASGAATCEAIGDADIPDTVTVTGWVLGTSTATQLTSPTLLTDLIDGVGAVDIDLGSADITDFTVVTDGGTVIIDGNITQDAGTTLFMGGLLDATGAVDMDYGSADVTDHTFITDSTGDAEFVVPLASISLAETAMTAGRSLTISTNDVLADAELYTWTLDKTIETPVDTDNFVIQAKVPAASTITNIQCIVEAATSATIRIDECDVAGDNCAGIDGATTIVCDVGGQADDAALSNATIDANDSLRFVVTAVSGTPGHVTVTIMGTRDD